MPSTRRDVLTYSLGLGSAAVFAQDTKQSLPTVGQALALPEASLLGGGTFKPAQARGKVTVIYWWASWCPFCMIQSPHIEALWKAHQSRGLQMLTLSIDKTEAAAKDYLAKKNYSFPAAMFTPAIAKTLPKPKGLPVVIVRGKDGKVLHAESGEMFPEDIEKIGKWV
ncbi:TlpA disulfide reductase family protein [Variovorax sp. PCZ-1]|uniref:TlpA family protein disulfide reductase n=1 Tax=Variovorax sp. PCZ-1 TaxID=2835533 RepID=UPI001BCCCAA9|nr:TlpA disulfide reductase family protein [Variovorax sp. PCZ-1]MBS7809088.1 TlpA family protein disulfide reductase [Variovorax sp. PCZ-1]